MAKDPVTDNDCPDPKVDLTRGIYQYETQTCGTYQITREAFDDLRENPKYRDKLHLLAGALREASEKGFKTVLTTSNIDQIISTANKPRHPLEAIERILIFIYRFEKLPYEYTTFEWLDYTITYSKNFKEFEYYLEKARDLGLIEVSGNLRTCRLTIDGWQRVDALLRASIDSKQAFVAMWFDKKMDLALTEGIMPALKESGFRPVRVDLLEHNEKIDDKIIAEINISGLLIADFTGNRGGVYFEAGYALGRGITVIWTCQRTK